MPANDVDHVSCLLDRNRMRRHSSQGSSDLFYDAPIAPQSIDASLAASASPPPPAPLRTNTFPSRDLTDTHNNGRASPDPHEYYRQHQRSVTAENGIGSHTIRPPQSQRIASLPSYNGFETSPRATNGQQNRSTSDSYRRIGLDSTRPTPNPSQPPRSRQVSFKDLINKFENKSDQVLPVPSRSQESTPTTPAGSPTTTKSRPVTHRWNTTSPKDSSIDTVTPAGTDRDTGGKARGHSDIPPSSPSRPALRFGERLSVDTSGGTLPHLRRRGSEGSIPSPNPAALDQVDPSPGQTPLTPTAWYLGKTPFLEAVDPTATHRRARSDFPRSTSNNLTAAGSAQPSSPLAPPAPGPLQWQQQQRQLSPSTSPENSHSKSRIPVSSRRLNSDSHWDTPPKASSTTFSSRSSAPIPLPLRGTSRLPKPSSPPESLPGMTDDEGPQPAHGRVRHQQPGKNTLLQAYIAAPPPQRSTPPLRSSKPRQPVSNATSPTPPRSKVVERVSTIQRQINRDRDPRGSRRERRLPELGHVDFASRRQQIQQAFNRTVQENERKEEEAAEIRRQVQVEEEKPSDSYIAPEQLREDTVQQGTVGKVPPPPAEDATTVIEDQVDTLPDEQPPPLQLYPNIQQPEIPPIPQLHIETNIPTLPELTGSNSTIHPVAMDSPTLGLPVAKVKDEAAPRSEPKPSHNQPMSAVTLESADTHVTTLDPEPQSGLGLPRLDTSHRTLLSQIMQIRESSPSSSSSCDEPDYSPSDNDDKESIPIMLRDANCAEDSVDDSDNQEARDLPQDQFGDEPRSNRWSMSSWSSDQPFADAQFDESSGEDLGHLAPDDSEAATLSCSASSSTPPSIVGHQFTVTPPQPGSSAESNYETASTRSTIGISNAPSLARLGGWDSKRVTQLYFEELARGRGPNLTVPPAHVSPEPRRQTDTGQREDGRTDSLTDDPVMVPSFEDVPSSDQARNSASLVFRDDWEHASPSIADWMQVAADDDSGASDKGKKGSSPGRDGAPTPRNQTSKSPQPGSDESKTLGLAINVQGPQEVDFDKFDASMESQGLSSTAPVTTTKRAPPTPPPPQHSARTSSGQQQQQVPSHAAQGNHFAPLGHIQSTGSSESSFRRLEPIPSPQAHPVGSSVTSLAASHSDPISVDVKRPSPSPEQRRLKKRRHVMKELVDTEYNFGRDMKVVNDIYKGTSSSCLDLSTDDVKILFGNSDHVVQFSVAFLDALKNSAKSVYVMPKSQRWTSRRARNKHMSALHDEQAAAAGSDLSDFGKDQATFIGQAFMTHVHQMEKVYTDYLKNHDAANKKLQTLQKNPKVAIWLKECRDWASDLTTAWDLDSLLVKPVQRILKYPLLLNELLDSTPTEHPDYALLVNALDEVTNISVRINEMKKRADLVGQVVGRKRNQSDVRAGLSKAFGRRTEKLRQQVGLSDMFVEDKDYDTLTQRFGDSYFQLQVVMRDVEMYTQEAQGYMDRFKEFILAIEGYIDVAQSNYPEMETKWRQLKITVEDIMMVALPDHLDVVRKSVIDPMVTLLKLHEGPQRVMRKRDKRLMDYARFKTVKERGDKSDKKTTEQGEQFMALNETLKDELPKLYSLTAKLMEACLKNFVQIQTTWWNILQKRLGPLVDSFPNDVEKIFNEWASDFTFSDAQILSLGICNGSLLVDTIGQVSYNTPSIGAPVSSSRRPSTVNSASTRVGSNVEESPKASHEFSNSQSFQCPDPNMSTERQRANSAVSGPGRSVPDTTPEMPAGQMLQKVTSAPAPPPANQINSEPFPSLPQLTLDTPFLSDVINTSVSGNPPTTPAGRYSGFFSSAMPMSDNPDDNNNTAEPAAHDHPKEPKVLFLAASIYEFNIDRARREAGYPYLTYVAGEIFDIIAEKGELWLARNQDDPTRQVGWIWNKHFAKLSA